jgi:hypothetical protein
MLRRTLCVEGALYGWEVGIFLRDREGVRLYMWRSRSGWVVVWTRAAVGGSSADGLGGKEDLRIVPSTTGMFA